jgi:osmotically-inducible protein OsmY
MKKISIAAGFALILAVAPAEAKQNKVKTVVGCVEGAPHHYQLSTTTKKGKHKVYDLGDRDFHDQVGHKVEARGAVSGENFKVTTMKSLGSNCR